ncbi:MAG: hypothetical protein ThorAB25_01760 [Candidatus Thorarchaeota archaeon AB_25]|nr:MAG: hypothetical protein ThorAB25_01760 [Candidatus Thorarchaeota archaeon AB_25]
MSLLGKYRKEAEKEDGEEKQTRVTAREIEPVERQSELLSSVPNKERKSPIVSFSIPTDLRVCLQAIRKSKAINLSMWVEKQLREAVAQEFPQIADEYLES